MLQVKRDSNASRQVQTVGTYKDNNEYSNRTKGGECH